MREHKARQGVWGSREREALPSQDTPPRSSQRVTRQHTHPAIIWQDMLVSESDSDAAEFELLGGQTDAPEFDSRMHIDDNSQVRTSHPHPTPPHPITPTCR